MLDIDIGIQENVLIDNNSNSSPTRNLTTEQNQAYMGAKMFYMGFISTALGYISFVHLFFQTQPLQYHFPYLYLSLMWVSYAVGVYLYFKCHQIQNSCVHLSMMLEQDKPTHFYCKQCNITVPYRSRHCRKCRCCILDYDHHCFWVGNCIGRNNHRVFYNFLAVQSVNNYFSYCNGSSIRIYPELNDKIWIITVFLEVLSIGFLVFTLYLWIYHTFLISTSQTTWQHMRRQRVTYLKYLPKGYNPFSQNIIANWIHFCTENRAQQPDLWAQMLPTYSQCKQLKPSFNFIENKYYSCC